MTPTDVDVGNEDACDLAGQAGNAALDAFQLCAKQEGIIPALEPAHALAYTGKLAKQMSKDKIILMNMCGRGDKDIFAVAEHLGAKL